MEMRFENKIEKLADIVVWADGLIRDGGYNEEKYRDDTSTAYCCVKAHELWKIRDVVLKGMERHSVYTNALNKDIADKAAKIEKLEKEIEGRKEGYTALKERMDTKYISIEEHDMINKSLEEKVEIYEKEIERLNRYNKNLETANHNLVTRVTLLESEIESRKNAFNDLREEMANRYIAIETHNDICKTYENKVEELEKELADCKVKIRHQKENLDGINKTLEIRTKEIVRLNDIIRNQTREIGMHEVENARLSEKIISMNDTIIELSHDIDNYKSWNADLHRDIKSEINGKNDLVDAYEKKYDEFEKKIAELERQNKYLTEELEKTYAEKEADLKNHNRRDMNLVDELAGKNDEIKKLKEERDKLKSFLKMQEDFTRDWKNKYVEAQKEIDEWESDTSEYETITQYKEFIDGLNKDLNYWKDQERIRTDQLRATERKVDELWGTVNELKKEKKEVDEYVKSGFKLYVKNALTEAEGNKNEANEIITEAVRSAYTEWGKRQAVRSAYTKRDKTQKEKEETEVKGVGRTSSGRYPWDAKVNDIPCGEDSIE